MCYLFLIDNTASMNKKTNDCFPFISYAKSAMKILQSFREKDRHIKVFVAFSDPQGNPKVLQQDQCFSDIYSLTISPCGEFNETIREGLIAFNKYRFHVERDSSEPFWTYNPNETYSIFIFSNAESISQFFYKFSVNDEWLLRPDENVNFFQIYKYKNSKIQFSDCNDEFDVDFHDLMSAYDPEFRFLGEKINKPANSFRFFLKFDEEKVLAKASFETDHKNPTFLPFPYDPTNIQENSVLPIYICKEPDMNIDISSVPYVMFDVKGNFDRINQGCYFLHSKNDNIPFAILYVIKDHSKLILLPWNFKQLLTIMNPIPSKSECDAYLSTLPLPYIDIICKFFHDKGYEFTYPGNSSRFSKEGLKTRAKREAFYKMHFFQNDFSQNYQIEYYQLDPESSKILLETSPQSKISYNLRKPNKNLKVNADTFDNRDFSSLRNIKPKDLTNMLFSMSPSKSPISDEQVRYFLPKKKETKNEEEAAIAETLENITLDISNNDDGQLSMLEDLLVLLRDGETKQLEGELAKLQKNTELYPFVKKFLNKSLIRFHIKKIPESLLYFLN